MANSLALLERLRPGAEILVVAMDPVSFRAASAAGTGPEPARVAYVRAPVAPPPRVGDLTGWIVAMATRARSGPPHLRAMRGVDEAFSIGGGFLQVRSTRELLTITAVHVSQMLLARRVGARLLMLPQSVGPFRGRLTRRAARRLLGCFELVMVREAESLERVRRLGPELAARTVQAPDLAVLCAPADGGERSGGRVAISVRQWWFPGQRDRADAFRTYVREVAEVARGLEARGFEVEFLVQSTGPTARGDDRLATRAVLAALGHEVPVRESPLDAPVTSLIAQYGGYDLIVATRLHAALMGLLAGRPCIAIGYEDKTEAILRTLGLEDWTVPIGAMTARAVLELVDRAGTFPEEAVAERLAGQRAELLDIARARIGPPAAVRPPVAVRPPAARA